MLPWLESDSILTRIYEEDLTPSPTEMFFFLSTRTVFSTYSNIKKKSEFNGNLHHKMDCFWIEDIPSSLTKPLFFLDCIGETYGFPPLARKQKWDPWFSIPATLSISAANLFHPQCDAWRPRNERSSATRYTPETLRPLPFDPAAGTCPKQTPEGIIKGAVYL